MDRNFDMMPFEDQVAYVIDNIHNIPDQMVDRAINLLIIAGEIDLAAMLARDRGMIYRAIEILVEAGDYLWAGLMAKNAGMPDEAERIYRQGLGFYIDRGMFGRAVAAATALNLPQDEVASLFYKGIEVESQLMDPERAEALMCELEPTMEIARACAEMGAYPGEAALRDYEARDMGPAAVQWPEGAQSPTTDRDSVFDTEWSRTNRGAPAGQRGGPAAGMNVRAGGQGSRRPEERWVRVPITEVPSEGPSQAPSTPGPGAGEGPTARSQAKEEPSSGMSQGPSAEAAMGEEEASRWRTGSIRGMRSQEGTGALSQFDRSQASMATESEAGSRTSSEWGREGTSSKWARSGRSR